MKVLRLKKIARQIFRAIPIALFFVATASHAQGNLLVNGSFEGGGGSLNGWTTQPFNNIPGAFFPRSSGAGNLGITNIPDGSNYALFIDALGNGNYLNETSSLSQTVSTTPGQFYSLNFSAIIFQGSSQFNIRVGGTLLSALNFTNYTFINPTLNLPLNQAWQFFSFTFQATTNNTTIAIANQSVDYDVETIINSQIYDNWYYSESGLDAVSVLGVPEPNALTLLGVSLTGGLVFTRRMRRKN
jgi:hypothetical protein